MNVRGTSYSLQEDNRILDMRERGLSYDAIARVLGRSKKGLIDRHNRLAPREVKIVLPDDSAACTALAEACDALTARYAAKHKLPFDVMQALMLDGATAAKRVADGLPAFGPSEYVEQQMQRIRDAGRVMEEVG